MSSPEAVAERATRTGESDFAEFYRRGAPKVVHLLYAVTGDVDLARDCTQEAFARAWTQWSTVRDADDPLAWVRTVARRIAVSEWRSRVRADRRHRLTAIREPGEPRALGRVEDRIVLLEALSTLSAPIRDCLALFYICDLTVAQIAHETSSAEGTVKARLHRGRTMLAAALEGGRP